MSSYWVGDHFYRPWELPKLDRQPPGLEPPATGKQVYIAGERPFHRYRLEFVEHGAVYDAIQSWHYPAHTWAEAAEFAREIAHITHRTLLAVRRLPDARD